MEIVKEERKFFLKKIKNELSRVGFTWDFILKFFLPLSLYVCVSLSLSAFVSPSLSLRLSLPLSLFLFVPLYVFFSFSLSFSVTETILFDVNELSPILLSSSQ